MECAQVRELLEAYAVGALDPSEKASADLHLQECLDCQALAAEYLAVAGALPQALAAASPLSPPTHLRTRLLEALETSGPSKEESGAVFYSPRAAGRPRTRPAVLSWLHPRTAGALVAVLLMAVTLLWSFRLNAALAQERALRAEFANLVSQQEVVLEVIDSRNTIKALLRAPESGSSSYGKLYTRPDLPHVVVMAARLPQPPSGYAYHLWLTSQGQTKLAGVLAVNDQGFGLLVFDADRNGPVYDTASIALQAEGTTAPSDTPVLLWSAGQ